VYLIAVGGFRALLGSRFRCVYQLAIQSLQ